MIFHQIGDACHAVDVDLFPVIRGRGSQHVHDKVKDRIFHRMTNDRWDRIPRA